MFASATNNAGFHLFDELGHFLSRFGASFVAAQEATRVYGRLSRLSSDELASRGLQREDIGRLTLQALNASTEY